MNTVTHVLKSGLRVVLSPVPEAHSVTVMVTTATGSRFENKQENGMAHFLEHMLFKGTKKRPKAKMIAEALDAVGGEFNAFTSKDHTAYYAKVDARHTYIALDVVSDIFLNATLSSKEIEKERGTITEEINMYEDMPMRGVYEVFDSLFYGEHPLGCSILGPKKNIAQFTRAQFKHYLARNYVAHNTVVSVSGAFSEQEMLRAVTKAFATMRTGGSPPLHLYTHTQQEPRVRIKHKKTDQTHFILGVPSVPFGHVDEATVEVLMVLLGGGMSSRLFTEVREKLGLAYYITAGTNEYIDHGYVYIRAGVSNDKCVKAVSVCMQELIKIARTQVSTAELQKAQEYIKGTRALSLDTTDSIAQFTGYSTVVRGSIENLESLDKKTNAVTVQDVRRVAKKLFNTTAYNLAIVGPHTEDRVFADLLVR